MEFPKIFELLSEVKIEDKNKQSLLYSNNFEKYTLASVGGAFLVFLIVYIPDSTRIYSAFLLLLALILLVINLIGSVIYLAIDMFKDQSKEFLISLSEDSQAQLLLMQNISTFSQWDIDLAIQRMEFELQKIQSRTGFLVGAMDKLGIIPAIIALYISIEKILDQQMFGYLHLLAISFIIGIYLGVIAISKVKARYQYFHMVLCASLDLAKDRDAYHDDKTLNAH